MAYLKDLTSVCHSCFGPSPRKTQVELFNYRNQSLGKFCRPCGAYALKEEYSKEQSSPEKSRNVK